MSVIFGSAIKRKTRVLTCVAFRYPSVEVRVTVRETKTQT
uniref:Uncharacterized protein n=1 Tax=Anguilla anguilla TaxID=7936 RepID=A0A0E9VA18_ANGAN